MISILSSKVHAPTRSDVWDLSISLYCWTLKTTILTAGEWEWFAKWQRGKTPPLSDTEVFYISLFILSLVQNKKDLLSVLFPSSIATLYPQGIRGISTGTNCWRSKPVLWLHVITLLRWSRAWSSNHTPHPDLPSKTHGFLNHHRSSPWRRTWMRRAFNEPGRQHGLCKLKCQAGELVLPSLPSTTGQAICMADAPQGPSPRTGS